MRVLVCGGRYYNDWDKVKDELREWLVEETHEFFNGAKTEEIGMIEGGATGADALAKRFAVKYHMEILEFKADWNKYGKSAGYIRNKQMLDEGKPDLVIAFPGGKGTANMVKIAREAGVRVIEVPDDASN